MPHATRIFDPEKLRRYPHMFPEDIGIWERFLEDYASNYVGFSYDVKVGTGVEANPEDNKKHAYMKEILSKYRIDVVGLKDSLIEIIEVKPEASTTAIGQIITYVNLYQRDEKPTLPVRGVIITDHYIEDMDYLTNELGIDYYVL